jgi:chitin disaccharide deacetylase
LEEAEKEIRAQIDKALKYGIHITHLDNHMGSVLATSPELLKMYQRVGKDYSLPVLIPMNMMGLIAPQLRSSVDTGGVIVNNYIIAYSYAPADKWAGFYDYNLQRLLPGLNELVFHLAFNGDEMKGLTGGVLDYGAAWRQQDYDYATSPGFKAGLKKQGVYLVTWGMIRKAVYGK